MVKSLPVLLHEDFCVHIFTIQGAVRTRCMYENISPFSASIPHVLLLALSVTDKELWCAGGRCLPCPRKNRDSIQQRPRDPRNLGSALSEIPIRICDRSKLKVSKGEQEI